MVTDTSHSVFQIEYRFVCITKYRYQVLKKPCEYSAYICAAVVRALQQEIALVQLRRYS